MTITLFYNLPNTDFFCLILILITCVFPKKNQINLPDSYFQKAITNSHHLLANHKGWMDGWMMDGQGEKILIRFQFCH